MEEKQMNIENVDTQQQEQNEVKNYTQEDVDKLIAEATKNMLTQDKVNEIVEKRLAKEKAKQDEAKRLAELSAEERAKAEFEIQMKEKQEAYELQLQEFNMMKADFEKQQMLTEIQKELDTRNLPLHMASSLIGADAETTKANIDKFEVEWKASLQDAIQREIKTNSSSPRIELKGDEGKHKDPKNMSFAEFAEYMKNKER